MPRSKREGYLSAWHHVMNRGARKAPIFKCDDDCLKFLSIISDVVVRHKLEVHAYSLMTNHYHLLVRTPRDNLSRCMRHLNGTYTVWLNRKYDRDGSVFRGRFKNQLVEDEEYLRILVAYIHLNPVTAHLVPRLDSFAWTSHRAYLGRDSTPEWLTTDHLLHLFGGAVKLHAFVRSVRHKNIEYPEDFNPETGLFSKKAIARKRTRFNQPRARATRGGEDKLAQEILLEVCDLTGASVRELRTTKMGPRANPARRFAVWALQRSADLTYRQIAQNLDMPYSQVAKLLSRIRRDGAKGSLREWMNQWLARDRQS